MKADSLIFILGLWLVFPSFLLAQEEITPETVQSDSLKIEDKAPSVTTIINDTNSLEAVNLLEKSSGVHVSRSGGFGQFSNISIRGTSPSQSIILIDSLPTYSDRQNTMNLAQIQTPFVSSVEIYKGYIPIKYNSNPIGGLIEFKTPARHIDQGQKYLITSIIGSNQYHQEYFSIDDYSVNEHNHISFLFEKAKNHYTFKNDHGTVFNTEDDTLDRKDNNGFQQQVLQIKFERLFDDQNFTLLLRPSSGFNEIGGPKSVLLDSAKNSYSRIDGSLKHVFEISNFTFSTTLFSLYDNNHLNDKDGEIGFSPDILKNRSIAKGFRSVCTYDLNDYFEFNLMNEIKENTFDEVNYLSSKSTRWHQDTFDTGLETIYKHKYFNLAFQTKGTYQKSEIIDHNITHKKLSYQGMVSSNFSDAFDVQFSISKSFRYPSLVELFGNSGLMVGNKDLKPESATSYSLDTKGHFLFENLKCSFGVSAFLKDIEEMIHYELINAGIARPTNADLAKILGAEIFMNLHLNKYYKLNLHYTKIEAINKSKNVYYGKKIPGQPENTFYINNSILLKDLTINFSINYFKNEFLDQANIRENKSKLLMNASLSYRFKKVLIQAEIQNIANKQYEDFFNYPLPGRYFLIQTQFNF